MASIDPSDRTAITEAAYAIDAVQQSMQEAINQWEQAVERLEALEKDS